MGCASTNGKGGQDTNEGFQLTNEQGCHAMRPASSLSYTTTCARAAALRMRTLTIGHLRPPLHAFVAREVSDYSH